MYNIWLLILACGLMATSVCGEDPTLNEVDDINSEKLDLKIEYSGDGTISERNLLIDHLFKSYDKRNYPSNMTVKFGVALLSFDIDEQRNTLEADVWLRYVWTDPRLAWDKNTYGAGNLKINADDIWVPDITLYNSAELPEMMRCSKRIHPILYSTGEILWVPPCHLSAKFNSTLWKDPWGPQTCTMKFGSWSFGDFGYSPQFYNNKTELDLTDYSPSYQWDIISNDAVREAKVYSCCVETYSSLTFNLTVERKKTPGSGTPCQSQ